MYHSLLTTEQYLDCFQILFIMDKATVNIYIQVFCV